MAGRKALIVDDSRLAQFVLKKMLAEENLLVDTSPSAEDGMLYLKDNKPDIIFLDHTMPGMNGLEMLQAIKKEPATAAIPVMMYTSQEDSSYMSRAKELGALSVLPKQLSQSELVSALEQLSFDETDQQSVEEQEAIARKNFEESKEELEKLVYNAEVALSNESAQQKLQHKLEQQKENFEGQISSLSAKIEELSSTPVDTQQNHHRLSFWNNAIWAAVYCVSIALFSAIYFQQKSEIQQLKQENAHIKNKAVESSARPAIQTPQDNPSNAENKSPTISSDGESAELLGQLQALETLVNTNNQIPYDELLLGDTVQASLSELTKSLQKIDFTGRVSVIAHDGRFCTESNGQGTPRLATGDKKLNQCQINEASKRLADIASIGLLQTITTTNQSPDSQFIITLNPVGTEVPIEAYPEDSQTVSASTWNDIAQRNRRVEFKLYPQQ